MQYILSEDEYSKLKNTIKKERQDLRGTFQHLCSEVARNKPIKFWGNDEAKIWGCILQSDDENAIMTEHCDECPVQQLCPNDCKSWSQ